MHRSLLRVFLISSVMFIMMACSGCNRENNKGQATAPAGTAGVDQQSASATGKGIVAQTTALATVENPAKSRLEPQGNQSHTPSDDFSFSEQGRGVAYIAKVDGKQAVIHNGKPGSLHTGISSLQISPDGQRVSYRHELLNKQQIVVDGIGSQLFDNVRNQVYSPDSRHLVYLAQIGEMLRVTLDNKVVEECSGVNSLLFTKDSQKLIYSCSSNSVLSARQVIYDLKTGGRTDTECLDIQLAMNSATDRIAVAIPDGDQQRVIDFAVSSPTDINKSRKYETVGNLSFGVDGRSVAFIGFKGKDRYLVWNGNEERLPGDLATTGLPQIRSDLKGAGVILSTLERYNKRFTYHQTMGGSASVKKWYMQIRDLVYGRGTNAAAYLAMENDRWFVVLNGKEGPAFDMVVTPMFSADGRKLVYRARNGEKRFAVIADVASGEHRLLPEYEMVFPVVFSEDNKSIAYGVKDGKQLIWKVEKL